MMRVHSPHFDKKSNVIGEVYNFLVMYICMYVCHHFFFTNSINMIYQPCSNESRIRVSWRNQVLLNEPISTRNCRPCHVPHSSFVFIIFTSFLIFIILIYKKKFGNGNPPGFVQPWRKWHDIRLKLRYELFFNKHALPLSVQCCSTMMASHQTNI